MRNPRFFTRLLTTHKLDANRLANFHTVTHRPEAAGSLVYSKHRYRITTLVGGEQEPPCWIDTEAARSLTLCALVFNDPKPSISLINREYGDAIVAAV